MSLKYGCSSWIRKELCRFYSNQPQNYNNKYDIIVVGGGIVGIATARNLIQTFPQFKIALVEKEKELSLHQSGHNSGVIHGGIYYQPGSLKAKLCVQGLHLTYEYLAKKNIPYKKCGKLVVALNLIEEQHLDQLYNRAIKNNVPDIKLIDEQQIKQIEPFCQGKKAIHSPHTGIVDWRVVAQSFAQDFEELGGKIFLNYNVENFIETTESAQGEDLFPVTVVSQNKRLQSKYVITCGGLYSDVLSMMSGGSREPKIIPFRGEYLLLDSNKTHMVNGNIYPVPDPRFPFLGVHFTPRVDGSVWLGPNAILGFKQEGYKWTDVNLNELRKSVFYPGFRKLAARYLGFGLKEMTRSVFIGLQVKEIQKFIPEIGRDDIGRGPSGVRAQALDLNGNLVDDFIFDIGTQGVGRFILHCRNAPSPGATSSLAIAQYISQKFVDSFLSQH